MSSCKGAVASGHPLTSAAAEEILREGGNAYDAIIAAHFAACVVEPVLASLGGGGYLMAEPAQAQARVYDFFTQTPIAPPRDGLEFYPISADFGTTRQEFHIGMGSVATPGAVAGMFAIHRDLGTLPMSRLIEPAVHVAREGHRMNALQAYILDVVSPIYLATESSRAMYGSDARPGSLKAEGEWLVQRELGDTLEALGREGEALFYGGELAQRMAAQSQGRGLLSLADLQRYRVEMREPLRCRYRKSELLLNPPPSSGGALLAFALSLLDAVQPAELHSAQWTGALAEVMAATNKARFEALDGCSGIEALLEPTLLQRYRDEVMQRPFCSRGTTQISVVDSAGNLASMTVSNGEGCGELVSGSGIMLNNVLGEEDLNPGGFFRWQPNTRMTSMMAQTILHPPRGRGVLGSGGSNRLRTAILQVVLNLVDRGMDIDQAVAAPRQHMENGVLHLEPGACDQPGELCDEFAQIHQWPERNLYFGGVHSVWLQDERFQAVGDSRRDGVGLVV